MLIEADTIESFLASSPYPIETMSLSEITSILKTGDLIFFVGSNEFSFFVGTKWTTKSPLNHVGVIVKDENDVFVFEAIKEGVTLRPIEIAYPKYRGEVVLIRQLENPLSQSQEKIIKEFIPEVLGKKHDATTFKGFIEQIKGVVDIYLPNSDKDLFKNKPNEGSYFCSELVASVYIKIGLLPNSHASNYFPSNEYGVSDFSKFGSIDSFERENVNNLIDNHLDNEILILP